MLFVHVGEELAGAAQARLNFVGDQQHAVLDGTTRSACFRKPAGGITMPASPWMGSTRKAQVFGVIAARSACGVAERDDLEARRERPKAVAILLVSGEADDGDRAPVKVVSADDDLGLALGDAFDLVAPLARGLDGGLHGFGAGVHGQRHVDSRSGRCSSSYSSGKLIVAEGARSERHLAAPDRPAPAGWPGWQCPWFTAEYDARQSR